MIRQPAPQRSSDGVCQRRRRRPSSRTDEREVAGASPSHWDRRRHRLARARPVTRSRCATGVRERLRSTGKGTPAVSERTRPSIDGQQARWRIRFRVSETAVPPRRRSPPAGHSPMTKSSMSSRTVVRVHDERPSAPPGLRRPLRGRSVTQARLARRAPGEVGAASTGGQHARRVDERAADRRSMLSHGADARGSANAGRSIPTARRAGARDQRPGCPDLAGAATRRDLPSASPRLAPAARRGACRAGRA